MSKPRMGAPKRVAVGLLAGSLAMFGVALAPSAGATTAVTTSRLAGTTRYGTAQAISADASFGTPTTAIVATGENYPDALAASALAGASAPAPIILTQATTYTSEAKAALAALKAKGVTAVTLAGGTSAVSTTVENAIKADGFTVTRVAGADRYATAGAIASAANAKSPSGSVAGVKTALIATGLNFPDALAGGPAAYANKLPLLLVSDTVPQATKDAIAALGIKHAVILGGTSAVSDAVKTQLDTLTGSASDRLAGTNRFGTAAAVGDYEITTLLFPASSAVLATGNNFPDALTAGPLGGQNKAPIVLTASLPAESQAFLDKHSNTITKLFVSGGTAAIDDATVTAAQQAAQTTSNDTGGTSGTSVTDAPELLSASFVSQQTSTTTVKFTFDAAVTGKVPDFSKFHLYTNTGTLGTIYSPASAANVQVSTADNNSVIAIFPTTAAQFSSITLATVEADAVKDATAGGGKSNPEGDAALGSFSASAGQTAAPDLVSVGNYRADATGSGMLVDLTFDANAFVIGVPTANGLGGTAYAGIRFVFQSSSSDLALADDVTGQGTKVLSFHISDIGAGGSTFDANSTSISNLALARVYVTAGTIGDGAGVTSPLEKANAGASGITTSPDLVSASFNTSATNNAGTAIDQVTYTFDEPVTVTDATKFQVFNVDATTTAAAAASATLSTTSNKVVVVNFADGALGSSVGANVLAGAVTGTTGSALANVPDEAAVGGVSFQAGRTAGPDLIGAALTTDTTDPFSGAVTGYALTYTFDEAVSAASGSGFKVYGGTTGTGGASLLTGNGTNCAITVSTTDATKVVLKGCTGSDGKAVLSPTNSFLRGGFKLATVTRNAVTALDAGASNPEGAEPITGP